MPVFEFKAYEANGVRVLDSIEADTEQQAFRRLAARGLTVASLRMRERRITKRALAQQLESGAKAGFFRKKLKQEDIVAACRELSIMVGAGIPVTEALVALRDHAKHPTLHDALDRIVTDVAGGSTLSNALRSVPHVFPIYFADIVHVAEEGGNLVNALETGSTQMEQSLDLRKKVMSALLYPSLLLGVSLITVTLLVVFVLPRFSKIFQNMKVEIPTTTKMLLSSSLFLEHNWLFVLGGLVIVVAAHRRLLKERGFATSWTKLMMMIPIAGDIIRKLAISRALSVLSSMLASNVPLMAALSHAARISGNLVIEDGLIQVARRVESGRSFAESLDDAAIVPPVVVQMASVGEKTGTLGQVMGRTAEFFQNDVENSLKSLTSIIEPVMIVALGVFVGFITLSVITPIYTLVGSVK
jgi:type IV pilus assembly protein PilC